MDTRNITSELQDLFDNICAFCYDGSPGETGQSRALTVIMFLEDRLDEYHEKLGFDRLEMLKAFEEKRNYWAVNYYQASGFPSLDKENLYVFESLDEFDAKFPSGKYVCPSCKEVSNDAYACSADGCDWKVYGLFGDLGKGIYVIVKDKFFEHPKPTNIFIPLDLHEEQKLSNKAS